MQSTHSKSSTKVHSSLFLSFLDSSQFPRPRVVLPLGEMSSHFWEVFSFALAWLLLLFFFVNAIYIWWLLELNMNHFFIHHICFFLTNIFELLLCVNQEMGEGGSNPGWGVCKGKLAQISRTFTLDVPITLLLCWVLGPQVCPLPSKNQWVSGNLPSGCPRTVYVRTLALCATLGLPQAFWFISATFMIDLGTEFRTLCKCMLLFLFQPSWKAGEVSLAMKA